MAALLGFILSLSLFPVFTVTAIVLFVCLLSITGERENRLYVVWMILLAAFLWLKFRPDLVTLALYAGASIVVGIFYSFYRWFRECRKLRRRLNDKFSGVKEWPASIVPKLDGCVFNTRWDGDYKSKDHSSYDFTTEQACLETYMPKVENNRGDLTLWILFWFLYVLNDLTFKLIRNIQDMLKGLYHKISEKCFSL